MTDMPMKRGRTLPDLRTPSEKARDEWIANRQKPSTPAKPAVRKNRTTPKATWQERKDQADKRVQAARKQTAKKAAPSQGKGGVPVYRESQHPRDKAGRFVVKAVKATGKAIKSTAKGVGKAVKSAHCTVKRINADMRRRDALAHRERALDLHKREVAAGLKRPRTTRQRRRKR